VPAADVVVAVVTMVGWVVNDAWVSPLTNPVYTTVNTGLADP